MYVVDFVPPPLRGRHPEMGNAHSDLPDHIRKMRVSNKIVFLVSECNIFKF